MNKILFPDLTHTTGSTEDSLDGALAIYSTKLWDQLKDETNVYVSPLTLRERTFICWCVFTQLPDSAIDDLTKNVIGTMDFYRRRSEYRQRQQPKLPQRQVNVELGESRIRPRIYLPSDAG